jgi:hypothetical protein
MDGASTSGRIEIVFGRKYPTTASAAIKPSSSPSEGGKLSIRFQKLPVRFL